MPKSAAMGVLFLTVALLLARAGAAEMVGSMKLLAIEERTGRGSVANLSLEIVPGSGKIFIESFPLTKFDTQATTRFAAQLACAYSGVDCSRYDFFYAIKAESTIVGGPSAGAATAALTVALLKGLELEQGSTLTGTINSGFLIGPVSGIPAKLEAAAQAGLSKVLVPAGAGLLADNITVNLSALGAKLGLTVIEVSDLDDVLVELAGLPRVETPVELRADPDYVEVMSGIAQRLCARTHEILSTVGEGRLSGRSLELEAEGTALFAKAEDAMARGHWYSTASYCYGANVRYSQAVALANPLDAAELEAALGKLAVEKELVDAALENRTRNTITDLEAYMIAKLRLDEAGEILADGRSALAERDLEKAALSLAGAVERLYSVELWSEFFGRPGAVLELDRSALARSCNSKITEAEERRHYLGLVLAESIDRSELDAAYREREKGKFELCLFRASKAKAGYDILLSGIGQRPEQIELLLDQKLGAARKVIARQRAAGLSPIFGYSFYEYAADLRQHDKESALLYAEYAIELSGLDVYFRKVEKLRPKLPKLEKSTVIAFVLGFLLALGLVLLIRRKVREKP